MLLAESHEKQVLDTAKYHGHSNSAGSGSISPKTCVLVVTRRSCHYPLWESHQSGEVRLDWRLRREMILQLDQSDYSPVLECVVEALQHHHAFSDGTSSSCGTPSVYGVTARAQLSSFTQERRGYQ